MEGYIKHIYCEYCGGEMEPISEGSRMVVCPYCAFVEWESDIDEDFIEYEKDERSERK